MVAIANSAILNFGSFPGGYDCSNTVTGQTGILANSVIDAWITPLASADHSADEHWIDSIEITTGNIVPGTGFTIYASSFNGSAYGSYNVQWVWN